MTYVFFFSWFTVPILVVFREPAVVDLWRRMDLTEQLFTYLMALLCIGHVAAAYRSWRSQSDARKQSRKYAPAVAGALREGKIHEAIKISDRYAKSHLAKTVRAGLIEFAGKYETLRIGAAKRAMDKTADDIIAEWRRLERSLALSRLVTLSAGGIVAVWLGISVSSPAIDELALMFAAALYTAAPAFVAEKVSADNTEAFTVEIQNSQAELIDYFIRRSAVRTA